MLEYVQKTIERIENKIEALLDLKMLLQGHFGDATEPLPAELAAAARNKKPIRKAPGAARLPIIAKLPEPFNAAQIEAATGWPRRLANMGLSAWTVKGWLVRVGWGQYKRTAKFPGGADHTSVTTPAAAEAAAAALETQAVPVTAPAPEINGSSEQTKQP